LYETAGSSRDYGERKEAPRYEKVKKTAEKATTVKKSDEIAG
jgi:hypothetical protein